MLDAKARPRSARIGSPGLINWGATRNVLSCIEARGYSGHRNFTPIRDAAGRVIRLDYLEDGDGPAMPLPRK
jgi:hypothetical protein